MSIFKVYYILVLSYEILIGVMFGGNVLSSQTKLKMVGLNKVKWVSLLLKVTGSVPCKYACESKISQS